MTPTEMTAAERDKRVQADAAIEMLASEYERAAERIASSPREGTCGKAHDAIADGVALHLRGEATRMRWEASTGLNGKKVKNLSNLKLGIVIGLVAGASNAEKLLKLIASLAGGAP